MMMMMMKSMSLGRDSKHMVATSLIEVVACWVIWTKDLGARSVLLCSRRGQVAAGDEVTCLCRCIKPSVIWRVGVSVISGIMDPFFIFFWCVFLFVVMQRLRAANVPGGRCYDAFSPPSHQCVALNGFLHLVQTILTKMDGGFARHLFKTLIIDFPLGRFLSCRKMPGYGAWICHVLWAGDSVTNIKRIEWLDFWHDFVCLCMIFVIEFISCMHTSLFLNSQEEQAAQQQLEELQARPNVKVTAWTCHLASLGDNLWAQESTARLHQESPELATYFSEGGRNTCKDFGVG